MKKVLFLMFLLFLCLGAASVKAQVRIGGNTAPNSAAVLDLNATDAATGTKGLALPRVSLASNTAQITTGVANLTGMLVYNTNATLGVGIYFWNGSNWVKASLPSTSAADSGYYLMSTGSGSAFMPRFGVQHSDTLSLIVRDLGMGTTLQKILDTSVTVTFVKNQYTVIPVVGLTQLDFCRTYELTGLPIVWAGMSGLLIARLQGSSDVSPYRIVCYRPNR